MTRALGTLKKLDPHDAWPHEANDFTPWLGVAAEDAADHDADSGSGRFSYRPVNADGLANFGDKLGGDYFEFINAQPLVDGRFALSQSVIKADFVIAKAEFFSALVGLAHFFGEFD